MQKASLARTLLQDHGLDLHSDERLRKVREKLDSLPEGELSPEDLGALHDSCQLYARAVDGHLIVPKFGEFAGSLQGIYDSVKDQDGGDVARYIPQLARVNPDQFGVSVCTVDGQRRSMGEADRYFCVQSTSMPLTYGIALEEAIQLLGVEAGEDHVHQHVGHEPSGRGFDERVLDPQGLPHNPLINSGAILVASLIKPDLAIADRFDFVVSKWAELCGNIGRVGFANSTFLSEKATANRNYCLGYMMKEEDCFPEGTDLMETEDLYFMMCSIEMTCEMMSIVAATLANGGTNPLTGKRVFCERTVRDVLSITAACGMYDESGEFAFEIGFPAKSGVGGCIMIVIPGKMGICTWSPRLESRGNSVRGVQFCKELTENFAFHTFHELGPGVKSDKVDPCAQPKLEMKGEQTTDLLWSAKTGSMVRLREAIARQGDGGVAVANVADYDNRTALHVACAEGHLDVVRALLLNGADPNIKDRFGGTAFDAAKGNGAIVALLENAAEMKLYDFSDDADVNVFRAMDLDGTGTVTRKEVKQALVDRGFSDFTAPHLRALKKDLKEAEYYDQKAFSALVAKHNILRNVVRGELSVPDFPSFRDICQEIYDKVEPDTSGANAGYIPSLAKADPDKFGFSICTLSGQQCDIGDTDVPFGMQSMTKVINYCIAQEQQGKDKVHQHVGREPSGRAFNEICLDHNDLPHNPFINAGAIMTCSLISPELEQGDRFAKVESYWQELTGGSPTRFNNSMFLGERATADRNFCLGYFMKDSGAFPDWIKTSEDLVQTLELYFMTCSIEITSNQMAVVAATLANGGTNPLTGKEIFKPDLVRNALSIMGSCGMYDWSGEFAFRIGFPCKSGVGGGLLIVIPGKMGIATFSPRLDNWGNSVRGNGVCVELTRRFNFHMYDGVVRGKYDPTLSRGGYGCQNSSALITAASEDNVLEIKRLVLAFSVDVNAGDYDDRTALHVTIDNGHLRSVKFLLELGAKLDCKDRFGLTPAECAANVSDKFPDVSKFVLEHR
jgi:glutaminase